MDENTQSTRARQPDQSALEKPVSPVKLREAAWQPGDLDRLLFAVHETCNISTRGVVEQAGVPWSRAKAALVELAKRGLERREPGHHHGNGEFCQCRTGGPHKLTHWLDVDREGP
jgi:hypothetical protein